MATGKRRKKAPHEAEAIGRFISYLKSTRGLAYRVIDEDVVVDPVTGTNYDYQLAEEGSSVPAVAVEIFRLVEDEAGLAAERQRGMLWKAIKGEFLAAGLSDLLVSTPDRLSVLPRDQPSYVRALAQVAIKKLSEHPTTQEVRLDNGIELKRIKGLGTVACSSHSDARWIDGIGIATPPLIKGLAKKDSQLAVAGLDRVILCVNWAWAVDPDDAVNAISLMDVSGLNHVDWAYFDSGKGHRLIYARSVRDALAGTEKPPPSGSAEAELFEQSIAHRLEKSVPGAFELVRRLSERTALCWIKDRFHREAVVRAAQRKVQDGDVQAGLWAVVAAIEDPDPPLFNYPDDPNGTFNYHEQVRRGEDPSTSVGVRTAVCWLIQALVCKCPSDSWHLIDAIEQLATDENLYVRQNACVPLIEFAVRRRWKDDHGYRMPEDVRERTKRLAFEMLRANQEYPAVLKWLAHVVSEMPDLSDAEATEVLDGLLERTSDEGLSSVTRLLVFFAVFRVGHPAFPCSFDNAHAKHLLEIALERGSPELRRAITFTIYKTVEEEPERAQELRPYILALPKAGLDGVAPHLFYEMAEVMLDGADEDLENAIATMVAKEVAWAGEERGRFIVLKSIVPLLRKLADANRWRTILSVSKSVASATQSVLVGTSDLVELLGHAPPEFSAEVAAVGLQNVPG